MNRMFALFDNDNDGLINFSEFVRGLSTLSTKCSLDEKLECMEHGGHFERALIINDVYSIRYLLCVICQFHSEFTISMRMAMKLTRVMVISMHVEYAMVRVH